MLVGHTDHVVIFTRRPVHQRHHHRRVAQTDLLMGGWHRSQTTDLGQLWRLKTQCVVVGPKQHTTETNACINSTHLKLFLKCIIFNFSLHSQTSVTSSPSPFIFTLPHPYVLKLLHWRVCSCGDGVRAFRPWLFPGDEEEFVPDGCYYPQLWAVVGVDRVQVTAWDN